MPLPPSRRAFGARVCPLPDRAGLLPYSHPGTRLTRGALRAD